MARKQKPRTPFSPYRWVEVLAVLHCHLGDHDVTRGVWVRERRGDFRGLRSCEACLEARGIRRPHGSPRPVTMRRDDGVDVRARQVGGDD